MVYKANSYVSYGQEMVCLLQITTANSAAHSSSLLGLLLSQIKEVHIHKPHSFNIHYNSKLLPHLYLGLASGPVPPEFHYS
jgi:hypothetical protein